MRSLTRSLPVALVCALGVAACGGDDGLSRDDYVKQANAICRDANAQLAKIPEPSSMDGLADYVEQATKVTTASVDRFDALEPPEELRADHDAHVADGRRVIALADDLATAASGQDAAEMQRLTDEGDRLDEASDRRAERMGLTDCAGDA